MDANPRRAVLADKVSQLNDVELACITCLIAKEHCLIKADNDSFSEVAGDIEYACANVFGLAFATVDCSQDTSLEEYGNAILIDDNSKDDGQRFSEMSTISSGEHSFFKQSEGMRKTFSRNSYGFGDYSTPATKRIADVVIAKNLHLANHQVQIQTLELIRGKRIFTRTAFHAVPKRFLFVALLPDEPDARLVPQLNDHIFLSHTVNRLDDDAEEQSMQQSWMERDDNASLASVIRSPPATPGISSRRSRASFRPSLSGLVMPSSDVDAFVQMTTKVRLTPEIRAYIHNVVVFMRMHRAVAGGVSALATRHLLALSHALAPLHNLGYITPALVALAARKVYPHRLMLTLPEDEKSMQWGSSITAVTEMLDGITVEEIIDDVLQSVETPL